MWASLRLAPIILNYVAIIIVVAFYSRDNTTVRGFTRETLSALLVNTEIREWQRQYNLSNGIPPEHPLASSTDDVECFSVYSETWLEKILLINRYMYIDIMYRMAGNFRGC